MSKEVTKEKTKAKFDLSDGFGREDIFAIFSGIWHIIIGILKVILYPYVWIVRMFGRTFRFVRVKDTTSRPMNQDEKFFIQSIPGFFVLSGLFLGILIGLILFLFDLSDLSDFIDSLDLTQLVNFVGSVLGFLLEVILWIIGVDKRDPDTGEVLLDRFGILDILGYIFILFGDIVKIITEDALMLFLGIGVIGVILAIVWILVSETGVVSRIVSFIVLVLNFLVTAPNKIFNKLNSFYIRFTHTLGTFVIGSERLDKRNVAFHRKILFLTLGLGVYTFLAGLFVMASSSQITQASTEFQILFVFIILLFLGFGVGILEMLIIVRFLDTVSRGKYNIGKETAS